MIPKSVKLWNVSICKTRNKTLFEMELYLQSDLILDSSYHFEITIKMILQKTNYIIGSTL